MVSKKKLHDNNSDKDISSTASFSDKDKSFKELQKAVELIPTIEFSTSEDVTNWLDQDND